MTMRLFVAASAVALVAASGVARAAALLHYYPMNGNLADAAGAADGTLFNGASIAGDYLALGASNGYAEFDTHLVPTSGSYSVAFFARLNEFRFDYFEFISQGSSGGPGFYIGKDTTNGFRVTDSWISPGIPMVAAGAWHHIALTVDAVAGASFLYVNGAAVGGVPFALATTTGGTNTRLGSQFVPYAEFFPGDLDEVRIYDGTLTGEEVRSLAVPAPGTLAAVGTLALAGARRRRAR